MIDHREGNQLDVEAAKQCSLRDALPIYENQGPLANATQVQLHVRHPIEMFWLTVPPPSCGMKVVRSVALWIPASMSCGRSTGSGRSLPLECSKSVTITRSTSAEGAAAPSERPERVMSECA